MKRLILPMILFCSASAYAQPSAGEYHLKAAFLLNFAKFVEWPPDRVTPSAPIVIGVVGDDPFGFALDEVASGRSANGRPVAIRRFRWNDSFDGCQVLFVSSSELPYLPKILASAARSNVLTVADFDRFAAMGGMIELRTVGRRVRFDVNLQAATDARLKVSSKLLQVADKIHPVPANR